MRKSNNFVLPYDKNSEICMLAKAAYVAI